jgi:hypothetical protein
MPTKSPRTSAGTQPIENARQTTPVSGKQTGPRTLRVNLPFMSAEFRAPQVHLPAPPHVGKDEVVAAARTARSYLPEPKQVLYYGGLAALAAFEVIEWPVAAAIGVGAAVIGRGRQAEPVQDKTSRTSTPRADNDQ